MNRRYASLGAEVPTRPAQGSQRLTYDEMYVGDTPSEWLYREPQYTIGGEPGGSAGMLDELAGRIRGSSGRRPILIVGEPDIGKTGLAYALMRVLNLGEVRSDSGGPKAWRRWAGRLGRRDPGRNSSDGRVPKAAVIDLQQYIGEYQEQREYFGSALWMRSSGPVAADRSRKRRPPLIILDALDDLVGPMSSLRSIDEILGRPLFRDAVAIVCSSVLYRRIGALEFVRSAVVVNLLGLPLPARLEFARRYTKVLTSGQFSGPGGQAAPNQTFLEDAERAIRRDAHGGSDAFREPLHLIIELETLWRGGSSWRPQLDYYVSSTLNQEVAAGARSLTQDKMMGLLGEMALLIQPFEPEIVPSSDDLPLLSSSAYTSFMQTAAADVGLSTGELLNELAQCRFCRLVPGQVGLTSRWFWGFFLAQHIVRDVLTEAVSSKAVSQRFARLLPGGVVAHLIAELRCLQHSEELRARVIGRLWAALEDSIRGSAVPHDDATRDYRSPEDHRVTRQQLAYYLAITIGPGREGAALLRLLDQEPLLRDDTWVRRGVVVGLGMGGRKGIISSYIDELWDERDRHDERCIIGTCDPGSRRAVNVEFNLVLFGDAVAIDGCPDRCVYPSSCVQTISGMIDLLETEKNIELKRLVLFIILDLRDYHWDGDRSKNLAPAWESLLSAETSKEVEEREGTQSTKDVHWNIRNRLESILKTMNGRESEWREVGELRDLLSRLPSPTAAAPSAYPPPKNGWRMTRQTEIPDTHQKELS